MSENHNKKILCLDFDGVIHRYSKGWHDGTIYDDVVDGFFDWVHTTYKDFRLVIYSSRSATVEGRQAMARWITERFHEWWQLQKTGKVTWGPSVFEYTHVKPPAWLTIDDRAVHFKGNWGHADLQADNLKAFKPWHEALRGNVHE